MSPHDTAAPTAPRRRHDPVSVLFAAALDGDRDAEAALGDLALDHEHADRAHDAAVRAAVADEEHTGGGFPEPALTAAADRVAAFVRDRLAARRI